MRIALICPFSLGPTRGNITSVQRIARHLQLAACQVDLVSLDAPDRTEQLQQLAASAPDLLHAFHAFHAGPVTRQTTHLLDVPYLITLTGSDLFDPTLRDHPATSLAIADAAAITCFDPLVAKLAATSFPLAAQKLAIIPQGVEPFPDAVPLQKPEGSCVILLPAALRPVKGIDFAIHELAPLAAELPNLQLWIAGGVIDAAYAGQIRALAASCPWITLLGEVPYQAMGQLYATVDLVLNSSQFEGGMANALLEAMVMGKPVVARNIPGNRSLIWHGETGWLFKDGSALRDLVRAVAKQPEQRITVGRAAQNHVLQNFSPDQEATALMQLYHSTLPPSI
jgi:L-malate glycosyltransferase